MASPAGNAQAQGEAGRGGRLDPDPEVLLPRIAGLLGQAQLDAVEIQAGRSVDELVHVNVAAGLGVHVTRQGRHQAGDIGWAAGALEPGDPGGAFFVERRPAVAGQGVRIEEPVAGQADARQEAVVQDPLQHVEVTAVAG